ncbi:phosphatase PAP2 family protein [Legionella sp. WA2022007384]
MFNTFLQQKKHIIEMSFASIFLGVYFNLLVPISYYAHSHGYNHAKFIITSWDLMIHYFALPIYAYIATYIIIPMSLLLIIIYYYKDIALIRGLYFGLFLLLTVSYFIFIFFPVSMILYKGIPQEAYSPGFNNKLVRLAYEMEVPWTSFPSTHTSISWYMFKYVNLLFKKHRSVVYLYLLWFAFMIIGTQTLKFHAIAGVIFGILLAELSFRVTYNNRDRISYVYSKIPYWTRLMVWILLIFLVMCILYIAKESGFDVYIINSST